MVKQTNNIKKQILVPTALLMISCFYCLTTLLESFFHLPIAGCIKFVIAIPIILITAVITKWTKNNLRRKIFLSIIVIIIIFSRDISDRLFLGKQIAYKYSGQDAGFEELYLFRSGKCKITYGGILGVTENHYGAFKRIDKTILVDAEADLLDLTGLTLIVDNKVLGIKKF